MELLKIVVMEMESLKTVVVELLGIYMTHTTFTYKRDWEMEQIILQNYVLWGF